MLLVCATKALEEAAVPKKFEVRVPADRGEARLHAVDQFAIDLNETDARKLVGKRCEDGRDALTRPAPRCEGINNEELVGIRGEEVLKRLRSIGMRDAAECVAALVRHA